MVKAYQKFEEIASAGIVASGEINTVQFLDGTLRRVLVAVNETVVCYDLKSGERIPEIVFRPTAEQKQMAETVLNVTALAIHRTLQLLAVGYVDGSIRLFSLTNSEEDQTAGCVLTGHRAAVMSLCFVEEWLVSGSKDTDAIVWDVIGRCGLHRLRGHTGPVTSVAAISDCTVATGSKDSVVKVWSLQTGLCLQSVVAGGLGEEVGSLVHISDHNLLVCGSTGARMAVYQVSVSADLTHSQSSVLTFLRFIDREVSGSGRESAVTHLSFVSKQLVAVCAGSRRLEVWRVGKSKKKELKIVKQPNLFTEAKVKSVAVWGTGESEHALTMCAGLTDNRLQVLKTETESQISLIEREGHREGLTVGVLSRDESVLVTLDKTGCMRIWSCSQTGCMACVRVLPNNNSGSVVTGVCWIVNDKSNSHLIVGTSDGRLCLMNVHSGDIVYELSADCVAGGQSISSLEVAEAEDENSSLSVYVVVCQTSVILVRASANGVLEKTAEIKTDEKITCVKMSESLIAVAMTNNNVQLYYRDTLKSGLLLYGHSLPVISMAFLETGSSLLVTVSADKTLKLFSTKFGNISKSIRLNFTPTSVVLINKTHLVFVAGEGHVEQHDLDLQPMDSVVWERRHLHIGNNKVAISAADGGVIVSLGMQDRGVVKFARTEDQWFQDDLVEHREQKAIDQELANAAENHVLFERPTRKSHETVRRTEKLQQLLTDMETETDQPKLIGKLLCKIPSADLQEVLLGLSIGEGRKLLEGLVSFLTTIEHIKLFPVDVLLNVGLTLVQVQGRYLLAEPEAEILLQRFHQVMAKIITRRKKEARIALAGAQVVSNQLARLRTK